MTKAIAARRFFAGLGGVLFFAAFYLHRGDVGAYGFGLLFGPFMDWLGSTKTQPSYIKPTERPRPLTIDGARRLNLAATIFIAAVALASLVIATGFTHVPIPRVMAWWCAGISTGSLLTFLFPRVPVEKHVADHNAWLAA
jgi:hypothetical protein